MKHLPDEDRVLQRMAPGALSKEGFLGDDRRELAEILTDDDHLVESLGLSHKAIADALQDVLDRAEGDLGRPVDLGDGRTATYRESMGRIPCPFGGCGVFRKGEVELNDPDAGSVVRFTHLSIHMIRHHGFYQGRGTRYRLEPETLARTLRLGTDGMASDMR
jgi:hypothetical protein